MANPILKETMLYSLYFFGGGGEGGVGRGGGGASDIPRRAGDGGMGGGLGLSVPDIRQIYHF